MKRLARSSSGRLIYGPKWQNNEIDASDDDPHSTSVESTEIAQVSDTEAGNTTPVLTSGVVSAAPNVVVQPPISGQPKGPDNENKTWKGYRITGSRSDCQSMYRAALNGDWLAAEVLLDRDPTLAFNEITERGDRALHVAAAIKHTKFVQKLVERMSPSDLASVDGHGYTACCYAAISGAVKIADVIMTNKSINLGTARDKDNITPLQKAALNENAEMVSYFLESTKVEHLSKEEWFDLFLDTIRCKIYDVALDILGKNEHLATMTNKEGTALHVLARQDISRNSIIEAIFKFRQGKMQSGHRLLAQKLWYEIQRSMDEASVLNLIKKPPILHDAAKVGNVELITMLTHTYPDLIWDTDSNRHTMFHIAAIHRQENVFGLIRQIGAMKDLIAKSQDENGNNILHLAGELAPLSRRNVVSESAFQMQREITWFKDTDSNGHIMFHIAVFYRQVKVLELIHQIGIMKKLIAISPDKNENNILHLARKLTPPSTMKAVPSDVACFKEVEKIVPPSCLHMGNKDGHTPRELFSMRHKKLLRESETWMRNTADSCMLIATIMLTVVFAAAFTAPGGYNGETGMPILIKSNWFTCFVVFEGLALFGATLSLIMFWSIMTSSFDEDQFLDRLPNRLQSGLSGLLVSIIGATVAFMSAYVLVFLEDRAQLVKGVIVSVCLLLIFIIYIKFGRLGIKISLPKYLSEINRLPSRYTLFSRLEIKE